MNERSVWFVKESVMKDDGNPSRKSHDLRQPLNVISLAVANVRARLVPRLEADDQSYLVEKLDRIEQQIVRATDLLDRKF